ncbi:MAG: aminomethyltransferase, partial [Pseudomonadota bacterium]|nr:aminomethyltransferase [Pseudomonadota bacterium]
MQLGNTNTQPRLLEPGLWRANPGLERYTVPGGGSILVSLQPGDTLTVEDTQGAQRAEIIAFNRSGLTEPAALSDRPATDAQGFLSILSRQGESTQRLTATLAALGLEPTNARALALFGDDSPAGDQAEFTAGIALTCVICAPGKQMTVDKQDPPTPLTVWILRLAANTPAEPRLPDPLADPRLNFRIDHGTARDFQVRTGEFIQIIDVAGRECSDFLAFTESKLNQG